MHGAVHPLRAYRAQRKLTQAELAAELGVWSVSVSRWETGARKIDAPLVPAISEKTGIPPRDLRPDLYSIMSGGGQ